MLKSEALTMVSHLNIPKDKLNVLWRKYQLKAHRVAGKQVKDRLGHKVEFKFTFLEWCLVWMPHLDNKGFECGNFHKDYLVVCRDNDLGDYAFGNVRIDTASNNSKEVVSRNPIYSQAA